MPVAHQETAVYDYVVIGSGFGGSVSAMRLAEKGYRVLVLERGQRFRDEDFPRTNWNLRRYLWYPLLRCFGFMQFTTLNGVMVVHGSGVGGGSLVYANVLMEPSDKLFESPGWCDLADWRTVLKPHYQTARQMLGVTTNTHLWPADDVIRSIAAELGQVTSFRPVDVGVFFNDNGSEGVTVPDPYFGGEGPARAGCRHCGGCMVGCRYNAKNTLVKNYLHFAEKWGVTIRAEAHVKTIRPLPPDQANGARYEVAYQRSTALLPGRAQHVRARNVVVAAGALGTLRLLFHNRDITRTLPHLSPCLGTRVRTNSEALLGVTCRDTSTNYSDGISITSIFQADDVTQIEPVRFPEGSGFIKLLAVPLVSAGSSIVNRVMHVAAAILRRPIDFLRTRLPPDWARRTTILLVMQTEDNLMRLRPGRHLFSGFRRSLVVEQDAENPVKAHIPIGQRVTQAFAERSNGVALAPLHENLLNMPTTAHILGGVPFGRSGEDGVVDLNCEVYNYPGLYVVDGSIMPANPGVNPSLTITALAEYAMSRIPPNGHSASGISLQQQAAHRDE